MISICNAITITTHLMMASEGLEKSVLLSQTVSMLVYRRFW